MLLPEICIRRPVFTIVLSLMVMSLGAIFFSKLEVRETPNIAPPIIIVDSMYPGADAAYMEKQITGCIEKELKNVKSLEVLSSTSSVGKSTIMLEFSLNADIDRALSDVRSIMSDMMPNLPSDMKAPFVGKVDSDSWPSLWISVSSASYDDLELTRIARNQIQSALEKLPTVGNARVFGARDYSMVVEPINSQMFQYKVTPAEIEQAIRAQNRDYPVGTIETNARSFSISLSGTLNSVEEFQNIVIRKYKDDSLLKLKDIANVRIEPYDNKVILRYNGQASIAVGLVKQSTANIIELSDTAKKALVNIKKNLPKGVDVEIAYDAAVPVKASIQSVYLTIFESIILVGLVIYVFLGSLRITIIPMVTIPISLIGTFTAMYFLGFSINIFTILAMILAVGLVVDDAVVVLENIFRHKYELGKKSFVAALDGSKEIGFAVIAMTITLASVFLPIGLVSGMLGKLFIEFAWTLAFCVLFSGFVALTLTPMMTSRMMKQQQVTKSYFLQKFDIFFLKTQSIYIKYVELALCNKLKFYAICASSILLLVVSFIYVHKEFLPDDDQGFLQISYTGPEGSNLEQSLATVIESEKILSSRKDILGFLEVVGSSGSDSAFAFVPLLDWSRRKKSHKQIKEELNKEFNKKIPSMSIYVSSPSPIGGGGRSNSNSVQFNLQTSLEYSELDILSQKFVERMEANPIFQNVGRDFKASTPTLEIIVNREKAYRYGINIDSLGSTIQYLIAGKTVGDFRMGTDVYNVVVRYNEENRSHTSDLKSIYIKNSKEEMLPLETIANIVETITVKQYKHYNTFNVIDISSGLAPNVTLGEAVEEIEAIQNDLLDASNTQINFLGSIKQMSESSNETIMIFLFALVFIYLVLSAQFESFTDPLIILTAVPFSITGAVLILFIFGNSINMYSNIGLVTLIGLVTKNSIMLVEFTNQLREGGMKLNEAVLEASKLRLRPILMTSIATIFGAIPLVLATGAGAASRNSIGLVIVGGMLLGAIFTIFVIPVLYQTFKKEKRLV